MTVKTMPMAPGAFIGSEANNTRSRQAVTIKQSQVLNAGHVVGEELAGTITATAAPGSTGDGALGTVTSTSGVQAGDYVLTITAAQADAGVFQLVARKAVVTGGDLTYFDGVTDTDKAAAEEQLNKLGIIVG
jgi:hypothetical protein